MLSMPQCLPILSRPQIFHWLSLQSMNGLMVNTINIHNLSLQCFNAVKCAKCGSINSTAEISVKFLFVTTVRIWVLIFHWLCAHANLPIHMAGRVYSHCVILNTSSFCTIISIILNVLQLLFCFVHISFRTVQNVRKVEQDFPVCYWVVGVTQLFYRIAQCCSCIGLRTIQCILLLCCCVTFR